LWRNYIVACVRNLLKNKVYAVINVAGLAMGLAACLLLLLYVRFETSYDAWLPNSENTYQLQSIQRSRQTGEETRLQMAPYVAKQRLEADLPQIDRAVYAMASEPVILRNGESLPSHDVLLVDGPFLDVLGFPLVQGDPDSALSQVGSTVLTASEARRIFGTENAMGKTLSLVSHGRTTDYRVTGIARDLPSHSHVRFTIIARFDPATYFAGTPLLTDWTWHSGWVYFTLEPGADPAAIRAAMPNWTQRNVPDFRREPGTGLGDIEQDWAITNVRDVHLGDSQKGAMTPGNDKRTIVTFTVIALMILLMACINFTNLTTARSSQRAREIALRKVLGARRSELTVQFLMESTILTGVAMLTALVLVELTVPVLSGFLDIELTLDYLGPNGLLLLVVPATILVGVTAGLYPALFLSRFRPANILKANKSTPEISGSPWLRNALVVTQFSISIGLIICTAVIYMQTRYAQLADPGYDRDGLIQVENFGRGQLRDRAEAIVQEIRRIPGIISVGRGSIGVATENETSITVQVPGQNAPVTIGNYSVDLGFFDTMRIERLAGRLFSERQRADDSTVSPGSDARTARQLANRGVNVVINALAARRLGFQDPATAVGATVMAPHFGPDVGPVPTHIIGVVQDSRFRSIRQPIEPTMFRYDTASVNTLLLRYRPSDRQQVGARVAQAWARLAPDVPFDGEFSESRVMALYLAEEARTKAFASFALVGIVIACLGLYALATYEAERRTKEIGIRKVLGARARDIVQLLAWQYSKPVLLANFLAWPVAWWAMREWLNNFDARIDLGLVPFLAGGVLTLVIALFTVALRVLKVARTQPIHALRYE